MPGDIAIATTKRKFYKALDAFTSTSQVSLAPSTTSSTAEKRPATATAAFDEARERARKRLRHSTSSGSLPPVTIPAATPTKKVDGKPRELPNYSPWSHEQFLKRLKTFASVSLWHPKPEVIGEVEWAKRGWVCVDVNTVACKGGCERRVVVSLGSPKQENGSEEDEEDEGEESALEQALAERYKDVIVEGHGANCLWRKDGCQDDIYRLQVVRPSVWQPELRKRVESIYAISSAIENVGTNPVDKASDPKILPTSRLLADLPKELTSNPSADSTTTDSTSEQVFDIALHGWRGTKESSSDLLNCDACFQRIGLWMYQPDYKPPGSPPMDEDSEESHTIDLVEMHREHCPYRNALTQKATGTLKGLNACQILHRVVSTFARDQRRRSDEQNHIQKVGVDGGDNDDEEMAVENAPVYSKEEIERQDRERESRFRKLKAMFTIKRGSKSVPKAGLAQ